MAVESFTNLLTVLTVISALVSIPLGALFLWLAGKLMSLKRNRYVKALWVVALVWLLETCLSLAVWIVSGGLLIKALMVFIAFLVFFPLSWLLVKGAYRIGWTKSLLVWLIWIGFSVVGIGILMFLLGIIFALAGLTALFASSIGA
jgi:hypothetical protein